MGATEVLPGFGADTAVADERNIAHYCRHAALVAVGKTWRRHDVETRQWWTVDSMSGLAWQAIYNVLGNQAVSVLYTIFSQDSASWVRCEVLLL